MMERQKDSELHEINNFYHPPSSRRVGIQLAYPLEEKRLAKWVPPYIVQPKFDGDRCRAIIDSNGAARLLSSEANEILSVPHINQSLSNAAKKYGLRGVELDGELYSHGLSHNIIHSIISQQYDLHPQFEDIQLHLFDLIEPGPQVLRLTHLLELPKIENTILTPFKLCTTFEEVLEQLRWAKEEKYEGIIVRHPNAQYIRRRSIWMMKFKPKRRDIYQIIACNEEVSKEGIPKNRLGSFTCISQVGEETFNAGLSMTHLQKEEYWQTRNSLIGKRLLVEYQHLTSARGVPRSAIALQILEGE